MEMRFETEVDGEVRLARMEFGAEREMQSLARWRFPAKTPGDEPIIDALEYARLASKRWRYYRKASATVASLSELGCTVQRNPKAELAMILLARPLWRSPTSVLGFAFCRRTWCNHLVVDFLAVHPKVIAGRPERIRKVGSGMLSQIVALAEEMEIPCVWGEATSVSAPFYQRVLNLDPVLDHFFIEDEVMTYCRARLQRERSQLLARHGAK